MLILEINDLKKYYGDRLILEISNLKVYSEDRIGIVGLNGMGKSTLLDVITNKITPEEGSVKLHGSYSYISQLDYGLEEIIDEKFIKEFNLKEKKKEFMSGGEKNKFKIAQAFSKGVNILFADEPTANLDISSIQKFQDMLKKFKGAIMMVSHDRELLDSCCSSIIEIDNGTVKMYRGNYSDFIQQKKAQFERQKFEYTEYIKEKNKLERAVLDIGGRSNSVRKAPKRMGNSEARLHKMGDQRAKFTLDRAKKAVESRLDKLEVKKKPKNVEKIKIDIRQTNELHSKILIEGKKINKGFGKRELFTNGEFKIYNKTRTAIVGNNGCGKTTLLKMIINNENGITISENLKVGYFSQDFTTLDKNKSIIENVMKDSIYDESFLRIILSRLLFKREDVYKKVSELSGGERAKVSFAKIMSSDINLLILDEPTNYLDIYSMEAVEKVLEEFNGTMIFVSHDLRFVNKLATNLIVFEDNKLINFTGNYEAYTKLSSKIVENDKKELKQKIFVLENRLSELIGRISMPGKNDNIKELNKEYEIVLKQLKNLKNYIV
ncbi:ribosomal protection-like ABC-F family protein [Clostridium thailandense]|uniref:ribosomal protection-like ABC-F family protein n=1 Tax=Clostridium thailandense TaxID=2794346 RepID=UPI003989471C